MNRLRSRWNFKSNPCQIFKTPGHLYLSHSVTQSFKLIVLEIKLTNLFITVAGLKPQQCDCHHVNAVNDLSLEFQRLPQQHSIISGKTLLLPLVLIIKTLIGVKGNPLHMLSHGSSLRVDKGDCKNKYVIVICCHKISLKFE